MTGAMQSQVRRYVRTHEPVMLRTIIRDLATPPTSEFDIRSTVLLLTAACLLHVDVHNMVTLTQEGRALSARETRA